jgi:hypothetical protein
MRIHLRWKLKKQTLVAVVVTSCVGTLGAGGALSVNAQSNSGASLAQEYLVALKPAGVAISAAEAKLERLPVTASVSQVHAIVASLPQALGKLEALTARPPAAPGESLESLGLTPKIGTNICGGSGKINGLFNALLGGHIYNHGFQLVTSLRACGGGWAYYRWTIPHSYTKFSAGFAWGVGNTCPSTTVMILGASGRPIPFTNGGSLMYGMSVTNKSVRFLRADIASQSSISIWLGLPSNCGLASVVDVIDDRLS